MILQTAFTLRPRRRGFHLITDEIEANLSPLPRTGVVHLFIQHTSAALAINENADPDVGIDLRAIFDRLVRERESYYRHTLEGDDDMPAHAKTVLAGVDLTLPVTGGRLALGTWQGIYLCEFRDRAPGRRIVATVIGDTP
ncbi:secondary thiamine-phosphate synthase enzyme YjbQ [Alistipes sp.]|uniref:secondary thiamine-phosphate synthase enzyme YjbQ n=1 Tax=Alistipes sp. TaxID=1872444 RepID=UPI003AF02539